MVKERPAEEEDRELREILSLGRQIKDKQENLFKALAILYREGMIDDPIIRHHRLQRERDTQEETASYRKRLEGYRARTRDLRKQKVLDGLLERITFGERNYQREKHLLKLKGELDHLQKKREEYRFTISGMRGTTAALAAEEALQETAGRLSGKQAEHDALFREHHCDQLESEIRLNKLLLGTRSPAEDARLLQQIRQAELELRKLKET